jgi:hypothetical protein
MKEVEEDTQKIESHPMFMDWNNQYCQNVQTAKVIYSFSTTPIKIPVTLLTKVAENDPIICVELQETLNSQNHPKQKE